MAATRDTAAGLVAAGLLGVGDIAFVLGAATCGCVDNS